MVGRLGDWGLGIEELNSMDSACSNGESGYGCD